MYQVNDLIIYGGSDDVYKVEDICSPDISGIDKSRLYYVLKPLYRDGKTYTPIDTNVFMRPIITCEAAKQLIDQIPSIEAEVYNGNFKMLEDHYKASIKAHDCQDLIQLIKTVVTKNSIALSQGKKPSQIDDRYMKRAQDMVYGEFAVALNIPKEDVKKYIEDRIQNLQNN